MMSPARFVHYKLGHPELDIIHWEIFQLQDKLIMELHQKNYSVADTLLDQLRDILISHNTLEDSIMDECNFPYAAYHGNIDIINDVAKMKAHVNSKEVREYDVISFEESFITHVDNQDRQVIDYWIAYCSIIK